MEVAAHSSDMHPCPICESETHDFGSVPGAVTAIEYRLRRCANCDFVFVESPPEDYAAIYDEAYYRGEGADPFVDYAFELSQPDQTVRVYEWRGIVAAVAQIRGGLAGVRWLDFGAGAGGLVRYVNEHVTGARCVGYDEGAMVARARQSGIAFLDESDLAAHGNAFDVVTMIEVVEHLPDPVDVLRKVRALLKPGGLLFLTTGNAEPQLRKFAAWPYVSPEIHLSYFTPGNLEIALRRAGFDTRYPGYVRGWTDIVRFKILKNLKVRRRGGVERIAPWPVLSRLADWRFAVSRHPVGFAAARDAHAA